MRSIVYVLRHIALPVIEGKVEINLIVDNKGEVKVSHQKVDGSVVTALQTRALSPHPFSRWRDQGLEQATAVWPVGHSHTASEWIRVGILCMCKTMRFPTYGWAGERGEYQSFKFSWRKWSLPKPLDPC